MGGGLIGAGLVKGGDPTTCIRKPVPAGAVFLPGEPFVAYQIHTQSLRPDEFVAVAANCNGNLLYLPLARSLEEGGYEVTSFRWCSQEFETLFKADAADLLT